MTGSRFIVCEQTNKWAVAFRRQLGPAVALVEARSLDQCDHELELAPRSLVAVEMTGSTLARRTGWLYRAGSLWPDARTIVLACRGLERADWLFRDAGAVYVLYARRHMAPVARLVQRFVGPRVSDSADVRRKIWAELPLAPRLDTPPPRAEEYS